MNAGIFSAGSGLAASGTHTATWVGSGIFGVSIPPSLPLATLPATLTTAVLVGAFDTLIVKFCAGQTRFTVALISAGFAALGTVAALADVHTAIKTAFHDTGRTPRPLLHHRAVLGTSRPKERITAIRNSPQVLASIHVVCVLFAEVQLSTT